MMSVPSSTSRLRLDASISCGNTLAGRRLANTPSPDRNPSRPCSGRCAAGRLSHLYLRRRFDGWRVVHPLIHRSNPILKSCRPLVTRRKESLPSRISTASQMLCSMAGRVPLSVRRLFSGTIVNRGGHARATGLHGERRPHAEACARDSDGVGDVHGGRGEGRTRRWRRAARRRLTCTPPASRPAAACRRRRWRRRPPAPP